MYINSTQSGRGPRNARPCVGIVGGGELAQQLALAAVRLDVRVVVLDPDAEPPAARIADHLRASLDDQDALDELAALSDVVTVVGDGLEPALAAALEKHAPVRPRPLAPGPRRLEQLAASLGIPWSEPGDHTGPALCLVAVRSARGAIRCYPLVETRGAPAVPDSSVAPAPCLTLDLQQRAEEYAELLLTSLDHVGVLTLGLAQAAGRLALTAVWPRVHDAGCWTVAAARTSQFENHLRAVLDLPLGSTQRTGTCITVSLVGALPDPGDVLAVEGASLHLYGRRPAPNCRLGHLTLVLDDGEVRDLTRSLVRETPLKGER